MGYSHIHNLFDSTFCGLVVRQCWADIALWELFLHNHNDIKTIVELGTYKAGMSVFFQCQAIQREMEFWTFDLDKPDELFSNIAIQVDLPSRFIHGDFFSDSLAKLIKVIEASKPVMLFVDGGNKPKEFAAFVPRLSSGDYVSVHDYSTEFQPEDIAPVEHLLEPIFVDECERIIPCLTRFWRIRGSI